MRFKVPFLRYALAGFAFLLPSAVLAAILPFLINAQPIREKLLREIGSWAGGREVKVAGAISLKDFFSLTVEAQDVEIQQFQGIPPIEGMKAKRVVARIDWSDLLLGNFDFDKIQVFNAVFKLRADSLRDFPALYADFIANPGNKGFGAVYIRDSQMALRGRSRRAYRRLGIASAYLRSSKSGRRLAASGKLTWKDQPLSLSVHSVLGASPERTPLHVQLASDLVSGEFDGEAALSGRAEAEGDLKLQTSDLARAASWLGLNFGDAPRLINAPAGIAGQMTLSPEVAVLSSGEVSLAGQSAQAALTLKRGEGLPHLEGTLAFHRVDAGALIAAQGGGTELLAGSSLRAQVETDLRLSARTVIWNDLEAGPVALTFTSRPERLTAEIAEFDFLGGEVRGHFGADMAGAEMRASARLSADGLDSAALLRLAHQRDWLSGPADVNVEADAVWRDLAEILDRMVAKARVNFPEGGQIRLDLPRMATSATGETNGWGTFDFTNAAFDKLRFEMVLRNGQLSFASVVLAAAGHQVSGGGAIDLATRSLDWRFTCAPGQQGRAAVKSAGGKPVISRLSIKGPWSQPVIRSDEAPDSSMLITPAHAAALELPGAKR